jgi:imidazolonepropionase-like amidohydrolase
MLAVAASCAAIACASAPPSARPASEPAPPATTPTSPVAASPAIGSPPPAQSASSAPPRQLPAGAAIGTPVAITDVTIVDPRRDQTPHVTVIIDGQHIIAVEPATTAKIPHEARVIDGRGKYLIPGLWDAHVHLTAVGQCALPLLVASGVTSVRDVGGDLDSLLAWRERVRSGAVAGPRMYFAGPMLESPDETGPNSAIPHLTVGGPEDAAAAVDSLVKLGVDFVSIGSSLSPSTFAAVMKAARAARLPVAAEAPNMDLREAASEGLGSIERLQSVAAVWEPQESSGGVGMAFAKAGTWITPVFVTERDSTKVRDALRDFEFMHHVGSGAFAGSDLGVVPGVAGTTLHDEMRLLVDFGRVRLWDALASATTNPPIFFGARIRREVGAIAAGQLADLVVIDGNPFLDPTGTSRISAVIADGRLYDRPALDALRRAASDWPGAHGGC